LPFDKYSALASEDKVNATAQALQGKGYKVSVVNNKQEALEEVKKLIPNGASVFNASSTTLVNTSRPR
jgi:hypothetical protein